MNIIKDKILSSSEPWDLDPGKQRFIYTLFDLIQTELKEHGDRDWIYDAVEEKSVRISHIEGRSAKVASGLKRLGFGPGDILHTGYSTCLDFYWPIFGAWLCGGIVSCADPDVSEASIRQQLVDTEAKIVVCSYQSLHKYIAANQSLPASKQVTSILVLDRDHWETLPPQASSFKTLYLDDGTSCPDRAELPPYNPLEGAILNWTSGTTGHPKGVIHTQQYMHFMIRKSKLPMYTKGITTNIFFHAGAVLLPLDGGILNRFTIYFIKVEDYSVDVVLDCVEKYKPTFYMCSPTDFQVISCVQNPKQHLASVAVIMPAGGKISSKANENMRKIFPSLRFVYQFYGTSEVGGVCGTMKHGVLGSLRQGVQVYIRNRETGERLGPGEEGEIMAKTPTTMLKYINNQEETKNYFDEEGFAYMGDLGCYDVEGNLYFKERLSELLKMNNYWVGPGEIEDLLENIPGIVEAAVWQNSDEDLKYFTRAAVVMAPTAVKLTSDEIKEKHNAAVPWQRRVDAVYIMDIPHNPQGKKLRRLLKKQFD